MGKPKKLKGIIITGFDLPIAKTTLVDIGGDNDTGAATFFRTTRTHFGINQGFDDYDVTFDIFGKGFKYAAGIDLPISGTVKKVEVSVDGALALRVEKLKLPALEAIEGYQSNNPFKSFAKLLKGNDEVYGSTGNDDLWSGRGNDLLWGRGGIDIINGFKGNDVNDGGEGNDQLNDVQGFNVFQFSTPIATGEANRTSNFDTIKLFGPKDRIYLKYDYFDAAGMTVDKGEVAFTQTAQDTDDFFLFYNQTFYYDPDANGVGEATPIFCTLNDAKITHRMVLIGYDGY